MTLDGVVPYLCRQRLDLFFVNAVHKKDACDNRDNFRNEVRPPYSVNIARKRKQIRCGEKRDDLAHKCRNHAVDCAAEGLKHRRKGDAERRAEKAACNDADCRNTDCEHRRRSIEQS